MSDSTNKFNIDSTSVINFSRSVTPLPIETKQGSGDDNYVKFGSDNLYPNFLLQLFNEVSLHQSIVKNKVNFLMGDGIINKISGKNAEYKINDVYSLEEIVHHLIYDYLIFNYYVLEVQYNVFGKPISINHIPAHHVRSNKSLTKFWVCDDWGVKKNILSYDRWVKGSNNDGKSKLYMFKNYQPSVNNVYPQPAYSAAIENMQTEILIKSFHKNNVEDGFSATNIISFYKGMPSPEQARDLEKKFAADYSGVSGKKFILNHNEIGAEQGVNVDAVSAGDYSGNLENIRNTNTESILTSHQFHRALGGIETAGSLGDRTALETQYEMFKNVFVKDNRNVIESSLNKVLADFNFEPIEFKDKTKLFSEELSDTTREKVLTIDELRALDNLAPLPNGSGTGLITTTITPAFSSTSVSTPAKFSKDISTTGKMLTGEDFELVKDLGNHKSGYSILSANDFHIHTKEDFKKVELQFDDDKDIEDYLIKNKINGKTLSEIKADIRKDLGITITTGDLSKRITALTEAKLITSEVVDGKVRISPVEPEKKRTVEVMYEYKVKDGFGEPLIDTSRGFCVKLIENDRLYSRSDIQQMSTIFGYDVFKHSGGWYFNPDTQEAENQCRHFFNQVRVIRKDSK